MGAAKARIVFVAVVAAGLGAAPDTVVAQGQGEPDREDGRALGQRLRRRLPASSEVQAVDVGGKETTIHGATRFVPGEERAVAARPDADERLRPRVVSLEEARKVIGNFDLDRRVAEIHHCRGEVAIERRVPLEEVLVRELLVRFTVAEAGSVQDVAVMAVTPTEPTMLDCVHRKVSEWRFDRVAGGPLQLGLPVTFAAVARPRPRAANR